MFSVFMSKAHFFTTESLPVYRTTGFFQNKSHLLISIWQPAHRGLTLTV